MNRLEILERDREALTGLHTRLNNLHPTEYNAIVHAVWRLDSEIAKLRGDVK